MRDATVESSHSALAQPTNCWTRAEQCVYEALPHLRSFRDMVGVTDLDDAQEKTFLETPYLPEDTEAYEFDVPLDARTLSAFGLVGSPIESPYRLSRSTTNMSDHTGLIIIQLQRTMAEHANPDDLYFANEARLMKNYAGLIMYDLWEHMRIQGGPFLKEIICAIGPYRVAEESALTEGRWQAANLMIDWGYESQ